MNPLWIDLAALRLSMVHEPRSRDLLLRCIQMLPRLDMSYAPRTLVEPSQPLLYSELFGGIMESVSFYDEHSPKTAGYVRRYLSADILRAMPENVLKLLLVKFELLVLAASRCCKQGTMTDTRYGPTQLATRPKHSLPALIGPWLAPVHTVTEETRAAYIEVARSYYDNRIPDAVALRWGEIEQGGTLGSRFPFWSKCYVYSLTSEVARIREWRVDGYVRAEYESPPLHKRLQPSALTWSQKPIVEHLDDGSTHVVHGIESLRELKQLLSGLQVASEHEYYVIKDES